MVEFGAAATLLVLLALAIIIFPLLRKHGADSVVERSDANLQVQRDQLRELDSDLRNGVLSDDQYQSARADLERRVLEESQQMDVASENVANGNRWRTPAVIGLLLPALAIMLYLYLGSVDGLDVDAYMQTQAAAITPEQVESMTRQLAQRLQDDPDDIEGWAMLGRAYKALQQFAESAAAWERAASLEPDNADILTNYAEALGLAGQGKLEGKPTQLLARALDVDPSNSKALALSGGAAFARGDYENAINYWQRLLQLTGDDNELSTALMTGIMEAQARISKNTGDSRPSGSLEGIVSLSPQMSGQAQPGDTVFIFVRAVDGPRMPLAVARVKVDKLPSDFHLDDSMAMVPDMKISDFPELVVGARVSKSGSATRATGDLEGFSAPVAPGSNNVRVMIDRRVP